MADSHAQIINVGKVLRDLRRARGMTGKELGDKTHISQSKISKIETGFYTKLIPSEIEIILNILEASKTITQQVMNAVDTDVRSTRRISSIKWRDPNVVLESERKSQHIRSFMFSGPPLILQTLEYHRWLMRTYQEEVLTLNQSIVMKRQELLWDGNRKYTVIMPEMGLYTIFSPQRVHVAQLDRLERMIDAEYVKLCIIPLQAGLITFENSSFILYDDRLLVTLVGGRELEIDDPQDINQHKNMFETLEKKAAYGNEARVLIRKAIDYFNIK